MDESTEILKLWWFGGLVARWLGGSLKAVEQIVLRLCDLPDYGFGAFSIISTFATVKYVHYLPEF